MVQEWALLQNCPIDFRFVFDSSHYVAGQEYITDRRAYLEKLLPLGWCNPNVRSVEVVDRPQIETGYLFYRLMMEFASQKALPALRWGDVRDGDYISVQIRQNTYNPARDSEIAAWAQFLAETDDAFVVIGEVDLLPDLPNVEKRRGPVDQDLQAIIGARAHMGATSGPCTVAWFNRKPYRTFGSTMNDGFCAGFEAPHGRGRFTWSAPNQWTLTARETVALLKEEHATLC